MHAEPILQPLFREPILQAQADPYFSRQYKMDETRESATEYFKRSAGYQLKHFERLITKIPITDKDHVFELGCGTAVMSARMAKEIVPNGQVTACDPEENRIRLAMEKFSDIPNLHIIHATGSAALTDKEDLYDVIVSNFVLHWIKEDELRKTMVHMFNALKSGGIAAHNFINDMPSTYLTLGKMDEEKLKELRTVVYPIKMEKFADLAREVGFVTVHSESSTFDTEFDTIDDLLRMSDASCFGLFGWEKVYNDAKSQGMQIEFDTSDSGKHVHRTKLVSFILKKP